MNPVPLDPGEPGAPRAPQSRLPDCMQAPSAGGHRRVRPDCRVASRSARRHSGRRGTDIAAIILWAIWQLGELPATDRRIAVYWRPLGHL